MADSKVGRRDFYVYALYRHDTGEPFYIGKGRGRRINSHLREERGNAKRVALVQAAIAATGDLPRTILRSGLLEQEALDLERAYISEFGRQPNGPLVNIGEGGVAVSGWKQPPEVVADMIARNLGKKRSPEWCAAISAALKGRRKSREAVENHAAALRGRVVDQATKDKISASLKGRPCPPGTGAATAERNRRTAAMNRANKAFHLTRPVAVGYLSFGC